MALPFPQKHSIVGAVGAAATVAIDVAGIRSGDTLLGLIRHKPGEAAAAVDTTDFTVAAGTITGATIDTSGYNLVVIWLHRN